MSRPRKCRKVCNMPESDRYGPLNTVLLGTQFIIMTVEEYETIRLIDLEGLTQEECACQMKVARTTVQAIYNSARKKLAQSLVDQKELRIEGGDFKLCDGMEQTCGGNNCHKNSRIREINE